MWFRFRPSAFSDAAWRWPERSLQQVRLGDVLVCSAGSLVMAAFAWIVVDLLAAGIGSLSWEFVTAAPSNSGRSGGIGPILVSTLLILMTSLALALPIGLASALFLSEFVPVDSGWGAAARRSLDVLAGMPSIVFGLFGHAFFSVALGMGFSILSGGLTLACMILPILTRACETALRTRALSLRAGAAAIGLSRFTMITKLLLPAAAPGLLVGTILGVGRALAETAALVFTSGYVDRMPGSLLDSGRALSVHIFDLSMNVPGGDERARASALALLLMLLLINGVATYVVQRWRVARQGETETMVMG